jgi:5'-3' exonuclease
MARLLRLLLVDINVLGFGAMREWAYVNRAFDGKPTGAIHGTLDKLLALLAGHPDHVPVVLWDDRCHWRERILPQYKRHRWATPEQQAMLESYLAQAAVVRELVRRLGIAQVFCPGFEADDLAGVIARGADRDWEVVLATTDTDWLQALQDNVVWLSPATGRSITLADLANGEAVKGGPFASTAHYVQAKALAGDASDGIPGVAGVGLKTAARIIGEHGSVEALWSRHDAGLPIKGVIQQRAAGPEYRDVYRRNLRLIDWRLGPALPADHEVLFESPQREAYESACVAWGLTAQHRDAARRESFGADATAAVAAIAAILAAASAGNSG